MSFWGGLGKFALKAAPIAASFIPGVGPLAAMGIGAASGGLSSKLEGGSVLGGALGGAAQAGVGSAIKGLGPSKGADFMGPQQSFGSKMSNMPWGKIAKYGGLGAAGLMATRGLGNNQNQGLGPSREMYGQSEFQNRTPNLEGYIQQGRQEAMQSQPWRQERGIYPYYGQPPFRGSPPPGLPHQGGLGPSRYRPRNAGVMY